ncbi:MAG TPA: GIDE domain-containing protein [Polyangia bacterium]|jgi:hypothetical protein
MGTVAALLLGLGILVVVWGIIQKVKAGRVAAAPFAKTGEVATRGATVANAKGAISVEGALQCAEPLLAPVTGTPCLYYELTVVGSWKEGDTTHSKEYLKDRRAAAFAVDDGTGPVPVDASQGGDFEPFEKTFEETKKEGFFADLKSIVGQKQPIVFGNFAFDNPPMSAANKFTCTERVFKAPPRLFVLGKHDDGAIGPPSWASLVLSPKSRDQVLGSALKTAKACLVGGAAAVGVGLILGVVAHFVTPPETAAAAVEPTVTIRTGGTVVHPAARPVRAKRR